MTIEAMVILHHWETGMCDTFTFLTLDEARLFAEKIEEENGEMSEWTGNTSDSRALRKGNWCNTIRAEIAESVHPQFHSHTEALHSIKENWNPSREG